MPYLYAMGAVLCWASLPAAIGSGLTDLSVRALMAVSFTSAAFFLYGRDVLATRSFKPLISMPWLLRPFVSTAFMRQHLYAPRPGGAS